MSAEATPPNPHAMLDELAQLGMTVARAITNSIQQAAPEELAANRESASAAFERAARAVRRNILLRQHLETQPNFAATRRTLARTRILRDAEDAIARSPRTPAVKQSLERELHERIDAPEL